MEKRKTYLCSVSFWAPMEGSIPVAATSKEDAETLIKKILHNRKDVTVIDIVTPDELPDELENFDMETIGDKAN